MALWNFGTYMLRRAPDAGTAYSWEVIIHLGIVVVPVFYFHFVLIFLERTTQHRPALTLAYTPFFLYLNAFFIWGLYFLTHASEDGDSSFRRNRARLIHFGTVVTLSGAFVDFIRFI